jgi:Tfp pilus assembly protein PilN
VQLVDPFDSVEWGDSRAAKPEYPGTFAPLLGVLIDEAAGAAPVIDFLHPRKKPAPPDQRRRYVAVAAAAAAVLLIGFGVIQWRLWGLDSELNQLRITRTKQEKAAKDAAKPIKDAESLDAFAAGDIPWLDELSRLSEKMPPPESAQLTEIMAQATTKGGGGRIQINGHVDSSIRVAELEEALRDKRHSVGGKGTDQDLQLERLQWSLGETIVIAPPSEPSLGAVASPNSGKSTGGPDPRATQGAKQGGGQ